MAARRLIAILIALMVVSTIAAALAPVEEQGGEDTTTTTETQATEPDPPPSGGTVEARIEAGSYAEPEVVKASPGDRVLLTITTPKPGQVTIPRLGRLQFAGPRSPARFDILLREPGSTAVKLDDRTIARIESRA